MSGINGLLSSRHIKSTVTTLCYVFAGHVSSKTGAEPSGKVTLKSKTIASVTREEQERSHRKTHCEESSHDSQILLPLGIDCTVSDKACEKPDGVNRSAECSGDSQASKLQVDIAKRLSLNYEGNRPQSVTGTPRQSSVVNNLVNKPKTENRHVKDQKEESFDPFAEGAEFTLPGKYRKLKATSTRLYSELRKIAEKDGGKPSPCHSFVERLEAGFDVGDISTHNKFQNKANGLLEEHERLSALTTAVVSRSNNLRDDSSWQDVYKCYRHWQIVLSKFNELQRRTQQLLEGE